MTTVEHYAEVSEVLAKLDAPYAWRQSSMHTVSATWDLDLGWQGALDAYRDGWQDGADRCRELAKSLVVAPVRTRRKLKPAMAGHVANVPAHLAGSPMSMYATTRRLVAGGTHVTMYVPLNMPADTTAECAFARGVAMVAILDALEDAGCRCEVIGLISRRGDWPNNRKPWPQATLRQSFTLKRASEPLNLEAVMFTVAHPAMSRRIGFRLCEVCEDETVRYLTQDGYGSRSDTPTHTELGVDPADTAIFPYLIPSDVQTDPAAWVKVLLPSLPETARAALNV